MTARAHPRVLLSALGLVALCPGLNGQGPAPHNVKELAVLRGHTNHVWGLAVARDGQTIVSGSFDKTIKVWDVATGKERLTLRGHSGCVEFVALTPDGKTAVAADQRGVVRVWDLVAGRERSRLAEIGSRPKFLTLSADGRTVFLGERNHYLRRWDLTTGKELGENERRLQINFVSPDGSMAAAVEERTPLRFVEILDIATRRLLGTVPAREPLAFTPDGRGLVSVDHTTGNVHLWELATGQVRTMTQSLEQSHIGMVAIHPHGRLLALPREESRVMRLIDLATGKPVADIKIDNDYIHRFAFSADGRVLAVSEGPDTTIRVWNVSGLAKGLPRKERLSPSELDAVWSDLASNDAPRAYQAVWALAGSMKSSAAWLGERLRPVVAVDAKRMDKLIPDLDSPRFAVRDRATRDLEDLGDATAPGLRQALTAGPSMEVRERIESLLRRLETLPADRLRSLRAVEALEYSDTAEARGMLEKLAGGLPEARLTREAKAAVERVRMR